jgi:hypothetical protein
MLEDALLDLSNRRDIVVDPFLGSGSTLIAADKTGRVCRGVELDPLYVDVMRGGTRFSQLLHLRVFQQYLRQAAVADRGAERSHSAGAGTGFGLTPALAVADEPRRNGRLLPVKRAMLHCGGQRFESPPLHQEVRANRRDFLRHRIARHFRGLPPKDRSQQAVRRFSGAIPGASCRKSPAANFRFQGCCSLRVHRVRFRTALMGSNLDT